MRRCIRFVLFGLLLFMTFFPSTANALPYNTVVYGPLTSTKEGVQTVEVGVVAFGKYDAAMVALGYDGAFINGLSDSDRAKLSNQETGGDFWSFAQKFTLAPNDDLMTLNGITWKSLNALYGYGNVRRGVYTQGEAANAKRDLQTILDGGSIGGGSTAGDGFVMGPVYYSNVYGSLKAIKNTSDNKLYVTALNQANNSTLNTKLFEGTCNLKFSGGIIDTLETNYPDYELFLGVSFLDSSYYNTYINIRPFLLKKGSYEFSEINVSYQGDYLKYRNRVTTTQSYYYGYNMQVGYTYDGDTITINNAQPYNPSLTQTNAGTIDLTFCNLFSGASSASTPTVPPSNWPDAPEVPEPTAPEVPEPTQPDLPSQPVQPTAPSLPDFPSNVIAPGTTYETFDIQAILDAMDEHCQHLQSAIYQGFSDYFDTFTPWLRDEFSTLRTFLREEDDWIVESICDEFMELRSYLKELTEWLADQMDFTISGGDYDDSTVVSWLKKIYYKLGGASVNTKPVDPVGDPDGSWDWLNQLIEGILSALAGGAAALTGTLGELFQGIKDKFPFSIPWDIVAIVALLDAPPVTPAAVIEYDVFGAHVRYDIDLHFFDEQASVIRAMEDVLFCAFLLFKTDWLTGIFDGIGGFLGGKLKSTVKGV